MKVSLSSDTNSKTYSRFFCVDHTNSKTYSRKCLCFIQNIFNYYDVLIVLHVSCITRLRPNKKILNLLLVTRNVSTMMKRWDLISLLGFQVPLKSERCAFRTAQLQVQFSASVSEKRIELTGKLTLSYTGVQSDDFIGCFQWCILLYTLL